MIFKSFIDCVLKNFRDLTKLEDGLGEKVVMFVHFMVAFVGSIVLALVKGWQLALVCMASLPVTFIVVGIVAMVIALAFYMTFTSCFYIQIYISRLPVN